MSGGERRNAGKPRLDLIPYPDADIRYTPISVGDAYAYLKLWLYARPLPCSLWIPQSEVLGVAEVLGFGAAKYTARGWEQGLSFSETFASAARHAEALAGGQLLDPESRLPHASHFWCNVLFLAVFTARKQTEFDDRPPAVAHVVERFDRITAASATMPGVRAPAAGVKPGGSN